MPFELFFVSTQIIAKLRIRVELMYLHHPTNKACQDLVVMLLITNATLFSTYEVSLDFETFV